MAKKKQNTLSVEPSANLYQGFHSQPKEESDLFVVRLFDMFDGWMDISEPISAKKAEARWLKETDNGTRNTCFDDGDYYKVFPAKTKMVVTPSFLRR